MKKGTIFLGKGLLIAAAVLLMDQGLGALLAHYYFRVAHGELARLNWIADSVTTPVLIIGSSRAEHGYVPGIIRDSFHLACYNTGKDKQGIFYDLAVEKMALKRYHPHLLILDITPISFASEESSLDDLAVLLPYYGRHPEIRSILEKRGAWEKVKTLSKLYCYNSQILQIAKNTVAQREEDSVADGYGPKFQSLSANPGLGFIPQQLQAPADSGCVAAFREIILIAKQANCLLAVTIGPVYDSLSTGSTTISVARQICIGEQLPFLDYSRSPAFSGRPDLFYDPRHLNDAGAQRYTRLLSADLIARGFH